MNNSSATVVPTIIARAAARFTDARERELVIAVHMAGDALDAAEDGSLHHAYPAAKADAMYYAAQREYARATKALAEYRNR